MSKKFTTGLLSYHKKRQPNHYELYQNKQRVHHHHRYNSNNNNYRPLHYNYQHPAGLVCSNISSARSYPQARATDIGGLAIAGNIESGGHTTLFSVAALATSVLTGLPSLVQNHTHTDRTANPTTMHCNADKNSQTPNTNGAMGRNTAVKSTSEHTRVSYLQDPASMIRHLFLQELLVTTAVIIVFIVTRTVYTTLRRRWARITVIVIGGGPIGLTATYIASKCARVARLVLYEELCRSALVNRLNQLAFDLKSITFLKGLGIDFDNLEGCWHNNSFATRAGIFQEYLLNLLEKMDMPMEMKFQTKVGKRKFFILFFC